MTDDFDLGEFDSVDEAGLVIRDPRTDAPTTWVWTFYGPAHPKTVELVNRISREQLKEAREKEAASVNGRKWKPSGDAPEELLDRNVSNVVARVKGWTPIRINGENLTFSPETTKALLMDRKKAWLLTQIGDFLRDDASFTKASASN